MADNSAKQISRADPIKFNYLFHHIPLQYIYIYTCISICMGKTIHNICKEHRYKSKILTASSGDPSQSSSPKQTSVCVSSMLQILRAWRWTYLRERVRTPRPHVTEQVDHKPQSVVAHRGSSTLLPPAASLPELHSKAGNIDFEGVSFEGVSMVELNEL